jgi:predicted AlkP superfamily pyrophosphatase or phosphodiesterase
MPYRYCSIVLVLILVGMGACRGTGAPDEVPAAEPARPYVILISFDGFAARYWDRAPTPALQRVAREGVKAEALIPVFPTKTFPNHYSIATGMYPEQHGIVGNSFFDPAREQTYSLRDREAVMDGTWYRGEPIWVTAERQDVRTAAFFWVGTEADIQGLRPTTWTPYDSGISNEERVDTVLAWLAQPRAERPQLITLYFSDVDSAGHAHGPDAPEVDEAIRRVDAALGRLLDGLDELPIREQVYLVLVSDHGMAAYTPDHMIAMDEILDLEGIRVAESGAVASLHVEDASRAAEVRDALNAGLRNGRAYLRDEVPARLRFSADPRVGDVVVIMDEPWLLVPSRRPQRARGGNHGWDPQTPSMHGIFLASGPTFRAGASIEAFELVHIYPLLAEILDLESGPDVQGEPGWLRAQLTH